MPERQVGAVIGRGARSTVFEWENRSVIKVPFADTPQDWTDFEFRYTRAIAGSGVRVPEHIDVVEFEGRRCTVSSRIEAMSMVEELVAQPDRAADFGRRLAEIQIGLFAVVPSLVLPRQVDRLAAKVRLAARLHRTDYGQVLEFLASIDPSMLVLCHGDLHPRNVLMAADGPVVIDWFDVCRGLPVADVARSLVLFEQLGSIEASLSATTRDAVATLARVYREEAIAALDLDLDEVRRWQAVQRIARVAEGFDHVTSLDTDVDLTRLR